jgi:RPA family protein
MNKGITMADKKRLIAIKTRLMDIIQGRFVQDESGNFVITKNGQKIGRARVLATVVDKFVSDDKKFYSVTIDDGSETIRAKTFNSFVLDAVGVGDIVEIVGKIRTYNEETYLAVENAWKVNDPNFEILRALEIRKMLKELEQKKKTILLYQKQTSDIEELKRMLAEFGMDPEEVESIVQAQTMEDPEKAAEAGAMKEKILSLIEQCDKGNGCDYSELIASSGLPEDMVDMIIQDLLDEGSCFEPKPGKIKKL